MPRVAEVIAPVQGMEVVWIHPSEAGNDAAFVQRQLMKVHGEGPFRVQSVKEREQLQGKERWSVTLEKDGQPVMDEWDEDLMRCPKPDKFRPTIVEFSWSWLKPKV
jgi:hypothetical protein